MLATAGAVLVGDPADHPTDGDDVHHAHVHHDDVPDRPEHVDDHDHQHDADLGGPHATAAAHRLARRWWLAYQPPEGGSADDPLLTTRGYRYVVVSGRAQACLTKSSSCRS